MQNCSMVEFDNPNCSSSFCVIFRANRDSNFCHQKLIFYKRTTNIISKRRQWWSKNKHLNILKKVSLSLSLSFPAHTNLCVSLQKITTLEVHGRTGGAPACAPTLLSCHFMLLQCFCLSKSPASCSFMFP
ncbi:Ovule protein [Caenorhabditis elegans]|uniref:Ovule protein n=1 Tax=Caenorhabditis elegans TaxID=6239 RepID=Q8IA73_CAEEL|nr:Ovule protein [Caenorhabditis elegans]CCD72883.1 Ovule protein [Caenorhabditis elegans]|eukprot:NP_741071.1 Uncharacterized protein CELE_K10F12.7 [Caenorhabditis elegans]